MNIFVNLHPSLVAEKGMLMHNGKCLVCIWRPGKTSDKNIEYDITVGEFLSKKENQFGTWLIDGGWGGPPGPLHVRWDDKNNVWENGGFCGDKFKEIT